MTSVTCSFGLLDPSTGNPIANPKDRSLMSRRHERNCHSCHAVTPSRSHGQPGHSVTLVTQSQGSLCHYATLSLRPEAASLKTLRHCVTQGREFLWRLSGPAGNRRPLRHWREFAGRDAKSNASPGNSTRLVPDLPSESTGTLVLG